MIVLKVQINCDKCRLKAMKLMASTEGVDSIAIEGAYTDHFVAIGDGVDPVKLARGLRKKVGHAGIVSVDDVKENEEEEEKKEDKADEPEIEGRMLWYPGSQVVVYDGNYALGPSCSIL